MNEAITAKEALLVEAMGDFVELLNRIEALRRAMDESRRAMDDARHALSSANEGLRDHLTAFEGRMNVVSETAKTKVVHQLVAHVDNTTRRSIELQSRAMVEAAKVAFGTEYEATMQRLQSALRLLFDLRTRQKDRWAELWIAFATGSLCMLALMTFILYG